jgi:uncharacterized protein YndB with AHSA1/START domain
MGATGELKATGATVTVQFDRSIAATPERVFAAITQPRLLGEWLADAELEGIVGGKVHLVWPGQGEMRGVVTAFEPNEVVEYSWNEENSSLLRLEVAATESGSTLRLIHSDTTRDDAPGFGAGWQSHLEALDAVLAGSASAPAARDARYEELRPEYGRLLGASAPSS